MAAAAAVAAVAMTVGREVRADTGGAEVAPGGAAGIR